MVLMQDKFLKGESEMTCYACCANYNNLLTLSHFTCQRIVTVHCIVVHIERSVVCVCVRGSPTVTEDSAI